MGVKSKLKLEDIKPSKIMIRDCSNFDFLDDSYVRIAVKTKKDIQTLKKSLNTFNNTKL